MIGYTQASGYVMLMSTCPCSHFKDVQYYHDFLYDDNRHGHYVTKSQFKISVITHVHMLPQFY